jgi:hypothetical protein
MCPSRVLPRVRISKKDRQFEELLRRAYNFLNRPQPSPAVMKPKKRSEVA